MNQNNNNDLEKEPGKMAEIDKNIDNSNEKQADETPELSPEQQRSLKRRQNLWKFKILPVFGLLTALLFLLRYIEIIKAPWVLVGAFGVALLLFPLHFSGIIKSRWTAIIGTALALVPQYYIRSDYKIYFPLSKKFGTYPGDLWYCWSHYLDRGFAYPREYPSGIQIIFRFIFKYKPASLNYEGYIIGICVFLGIFALLITYILHHLVRETHKKTFKLWALWIVAPTLLWYGLLNMDFMSIFTVVMAYYLFIEEEYYMAASMLALGAAAKVFPFFLAPLFFFQCPKVRFPREKINNLKKLFDSTLKFIPSFISKTVVGFMSAEKGFANFLVTWRIRFLCVLTFVLVWFAFNIPFMVTEWDAWKYPYDWQIKENYARSPKDGSYFWLIHNGLNWAERKMDKKVKPDGLIWKVHKKLKPYKHYMGKISLIMFALFYFLFLKFNWNLPFARRCAGVILLFLLTDRIYSPQYNLYLLPFLVLVDYKFEKKIYDILFYVTFYTIGIISCSQTIFLFKIREIFMRTIHIQPFNPIDIPVLFQGIVFLKYILLIVLFIINIKAPVNLDFVNWKDGSGKLNFKEEKI